MRTIFRTHQQAITGAKDSAISALEKTRQKSFSLSYCNNIKSDRKNWLIKHTTAQCVCGETSAIEAVLFMRGQQFYGFAGYCSSCGQKHPMP